MCFRKKKFKVGVVKHAHHSFDIDHPNTDSYKIREAGSYKTTIVSEKRLAHIEEKISPEIDIEELIKLNALPIGISTQTIDYIKEMTDRLVIPYDVLSDSENILLNSLKMPYFEIENKIYFKRSTLIVEKNIVKKVFYPIFPPNKHINEVLQWLKEN